MELFAGIKKAKVVNDFSTWVTAEEWDDEQDRLIPDEKDYQKGDILLAIAIVENHHFSSGKGYIVYDQETGESFSVCTSLVELILEQ